MMLPFDLPEAPVTARKANPVKRERDRLCAAAQRVLARLKQGPAFNYELCTPEVGGLRGIGRVNELQHQGWPIRKTHISGGTWRYELSSAAPNNSVAPMTEEA